MTRVRLPPFAYIILQSNIINEGIECKSGFDLTSKAMLLNVSGNYKFPEPPFAYISKIIGGSK
jgi:hypothetical protein